MEKIYRMKILHSILKINIYIFADNTADTKKIRVEKGTGYQTKLVKTKLEKF